MRFTLSQKKSALQSEKADIERLIERRHATPAHHSRLSEIEEQFRIFEMMEKPKKSNQEEAI